MEHTHLLSRKTVNKVSLFGLAAMLFIVGCTIVDKEYYGDELSKECQVRWPSYSRNGWCKWYGRNGLRMIANYKEDKLEGEETSYYNNGIVRYRIINKDDKIWNILEYNDGDGNPLDYGDFKDGNGLLRLYEHKTLMKEGQMKNGLRGGFWKRYFAGEVMDSIYFKDGISDKYSEQNFSL